MLKHCDKWGRRRADNDMDCTEGDIKFSNPMLVIILSALEKCQCSITRSVYYPVE